MVRDSRDLEVIFCEICLSGSAAARATLITGEEVQVDKVSLKLSLYHWQPLLQNILGWILTRFTICFRKFSKVRDYTHFSGFFQNG